MLFAVTQEMHAWAAEPKQNITRGGEGGEFVPFGHDGNIARNWKLYWNVSTVLSGVVANVETTKSGSVLLLEVKQSEVRISFTAHKWYTLPLTFHDQHHSLQKKIKNLFKTWTSLFYVIILLSYVSDVYTNLFSLTCKNVGCYMKDFTFVLFHFVWRFCLKYNDLPVPKYSMFVFHNGKAAK